MTGSDRVVSFVAAGFVLAVAGAASRTGMAQSAGAPAKSLSYDVVSVKENKSESGNMGWNSSAGGIRMENVTLRMLIVAAFSLVSPTQEQILGLPKWADDEHFDLEAKVAPEDQEAYKKLKDEDQAALLLHSLEQRFHLKAHAEMREMPIYSLVVAKGGSKLKSDPTSVRTISSRSEGGVNKDEYSGTEVKWVLADLSDQVGRQVRDDTGLRGKYAMKLEWASADAKDTNVPGIFTAVQDQWGLKLVSAKGPVKCVVVESVQQPSAN